MQCSHQSIVVAAAALLGLALPPTAMATASTVKMPLCGGGTMDLIIDGKGQHDRQSACHAGCANRRDSDDDEPP